MFLTLQHQNPPSLSTMLKWYAGRFFFMVYILTDFYRKWLTELF